MTVLEKRRIDREFQIFTSRHFEKPKKCKNADQIRFYVRELTLKMENYREEFDYIPAAAYEMLANYNLILNQMVYEEFKNTYC
ncbi:MAG: hypothetical protein R3345_03145 [Fulvivirga sp.]|nr:hypothetical protein [Fulvivirga sp.]